MKPLSRIVLPGVFLLATSSSAFASSNSTNDSLNDLTNYLLNLGAYLGYNLQGPPSATDSSGNQQPIAISQTLINNGTQPQLFTNYTINSYLGALLINSAVSNSSPIVSTTASSNIPNASSLNAFANYTFSQPSPYSTVSQDSVSVSPLMDQPPYQADPVSQAVLNILSTPDFSYCLNNDQTQVISCTYPSGMMDTNKVLSNTVGTLPTSQKYFTYNQVQPLLAELNVNSLITPMLYSSQASGGTGTPVSAGASPLIGGSQQQQQGLVATSPEQQAANFIRFATGAVSPMPMPNRNDYDALVMQAQDTSKPVQQAQAQATLASYLNSIRIYAAQSSVGVANLYYILSKRLPQNLSGNTSGQSGQITSQALNEFTMATWRLYNTDSSPNTQWVSQINNASAATVQKEMAILLAEINYQLYLTRQQQERLLLTNTMLLIQNARATQPSPTFTAAGSSAASTATGTQQ
ncbi:MULTISPECIES: type IVB secretion system protein IcmX [Legionella]|uniref:Intracellular multiplication protein IcmX n=1 Tax=Legionella maceachernii TaxID=466 RepID=A0A0W0VZX2_9GAMM|nr:type IVB secretion system protein IcmX [Legionella maceachernii]KTD25569.1 intracellular multiplication protein IcmX [Legionella maceachernii]SJZ56424.1 intracellular multiplication protein IcmX [Legionella maceachernii]SUP00516.1 Uncharacterised protein [Legionella maceachernii]